MIHGSMTIRSYGPKAAGVGCHGVVFLDTSTKFKLVLRVCLSVAEGDAAGGP